MLNKSVLSIPDCLVPERSHILSRTIAGIQLVPVDGKHGRLGNVLQLVPGSRLDFCGEGYDTRTVKVRCGGKFYFVFLQDLLNAVRSRIGIHEDRSRVRNPDGLGGCEERKPSK